MIFSIGSSRFDARPRQHEVATLREFAAFVLRHRARDKASAGYISAAFEGDGRRCAANAMPCTWLGLDVDGIDPDLHADWRVFLARWQGFGWPTASSQPDAPRERVVVMLSEAVARQQRMQIGALLTQDVEDEFGSAVRIDPSCYRPEQPCFLPLQGARPFYLLGDPIDVPTWLQQVPPAPPAPPPVSVEVAAIGDARMRYIVDELGRAGMLRQPLPNARGYGMVCPWERSHSHADEPGSSATALLFPSEANRWAGAFRCLHAHCERRRLSDLMALLRKADEKAAA